MEFFCLLYYFIHGLFYGALCVLMWSKGRAEYIIDQGINETSPLSN